MDLNVYPIFIFLLCEAKGLDKLNTKRIKRFEKLMIIAAMEKKLFDRNQNKDYKKLFYGTFVKLDNFVDNSLNHIEVLTKLSN
jgi:hypothetical protein